MLMILSPAKTFKIIKESSLELSDDLIFKNKTKQLVEQLQSYSVTELANLMKMSEALAEVNQLRFSQFYEKTKQGMYAIHAFEGEAYKGLGSLSLTEQALKFSQESFRILSGLYGVLRPFDIMNPYRLEMGLSWSGEHGKDLYDYWKSDLTHYFLNELKETNGDQALINLASKEYSKSLNLKEIEKNYPVITIEFKEQKGEAFRVVGMYAKRARGQMARYILNHQLHQVEKLKAFNEGGYTFNETLSTEKTWIFTR
ncbi:MAG: peroxide stress protein YaaA [Turicibacter sp.]|nr:peroxide stress protein YaaA [Turicibacter sp.]